MKFYYNDTLVRTSKNHVYTHAVIDITTGGCKGCRANKESAEAIIDGEIAYYERKIKNYTDAIKAIETGRGGYYKKDGRHTYWERIPAGRKAEEYAEWIQGHKAYIDKIRTNWQVVELEAR